MDSKKIITLISRYLDGTANDSERKAIAQWTDRLSEKPLPHGADELGRIQSAMWGRVSERLAEHPVKKRPLAWAWYAAAVALVLCIDYFARHGAAPEMQRYETGVASVKRLELADGSTVWLNERSTLLVPAGYGKTGRRTVQLLDGEAYFDVKPDSDAPFIVEGRHFNTTVLGTAFNIQAYDDHSEWAITVTKGRVQVAPVAAAADSSGRRILGKGERLTFDKASGALAAEPGTAEVSGWTDGSLVFAESNLHDVALRLQHRYGVPVRLEIPNPAQYRFSAEFEPDMPLRDVLEALCLAMNLKYEESFGTITISQQLYEHQTIAH